jgi:hypothetical protein
MRQEDDQGKEPEQTGRGALNGPLAPLPLRLDPEMPAEIGRFSGCCKYCGATVVWALTTNDRRIPLEPRPVDTLACPPATTLFRVNVEGQQTPTGTVGEAAGPARRPPPLARPF